MDDPNLRAEPVGIARGKFNFLQLSPTLVISVREDGNHSNGFPRQSWNDDKTLVLLVLKLSAVLATPLYPFYPVKEVHPTLNSINPFSSINGFIFPISHYKFAHIT